MEPTRNLPPSVNLSKLRFLRFRAGHGVLLTAADFRRMPCGSFWNCNQSSVFVAGAFDSNFANESSIMSWYKVSILTDTCLNGSIDKENGDVQPLAAKANALSTSSDHLRKYTPVSSQNSRTNANLICSRSDVPTITWYTKEPGRMMPKFLMKQNLLFILVS